MSEKTNASADKKTETKSENSVSPPQKSDASQFYGSPVDRILFLQRTIGNQAVGRLISSGALQTKLRINEPGDIYEQEADRVADQVMRMTCNPGDEECERKRKLEEEEKIQRKPFSILRASDQGNAPEVSSEVEANINSLISGGESLPESARMFFEPRFGYDFSGVRVHTDASAAEVARAVNARAFTLGHNVVFGKGEYAPETDGGRRLLGHELTHVVQQTDEEIHRKIVVGELRDKYEQEAEEMAESIMQSEYPKCNTRPIEHNEKFPHLSKLSLFKNMRLQRVTIPLVGWGSVPEFADSSIMRINPRVFLWIGGRETQRKNFSRGARESITIPLGSDVHLQIAADIYVEKDNYISNDENTWYFEYTWRMTVDNAGTLRIYPPVLNWNGGTGSAPWSVQGSAVQGERSAGIALTLGSTESRSSGHEIPIAVGGSFEPFGVGAEIQAGYTHTWGTSTGSTLTAGRGFIVDIDTPTPPPQVTIGPITITRKYAYYFNTNQAILGTNPITGTDENISLTNFLSSLDPQNEGGRDLSGFVDGYASPTGETEFNRNLARRRANYILSRIQDTLPHSRFSSRIYGEDIWRQQGIPEVDNSEKHRVVILEVRQTQAD
jgi:hypothetical protein